MSVQFNPKGVFVWGFLGCAAVCAAFAFGPQVGMFAFLGLAAGGLLLG